MARTFVYCPVLSRSSDTPNKVFRGGFPSERQCMDYSDKFQNALRTFFSRKTVTLENYFPMELGVTIATIGNFVRIILCSDIYTVIFPAKNRFGHFHSESFVRKKPLGAGKFGPDIFARNYLEGKKSRRDILLLSACQCVIFWENYWNFA